MFGFGPNSPVAAYTLSGLRSMDVISSSCFVKNVYVLDSGSNIIPRAAALYNIFPSVKK